MSDDVTTTPAGTPARGRPHPASRVARTLTAAGHSPSKKAPGNRAIPTPGFVVRAATGGATYVTVFATMHGLIDRYRAVLERAGFVVEDHPTQPGALAVYTGA